MKVNDGVVISTSEQAMLDSAVKNKDISPEIAVSLKKRFDGNVGGLFDLITGIADERLRHLMDMPYNELDKSGMMEELKDKYLQGYKMKVGNEFGNVDKVSQDAIADGFITQEQLRLWKMGVGQNPTDLISQIFKTIQSTVDDWMKSAWESLSANPTNSDADKLKKNYFMGFRQKYFQQFGMEYQEPPAKKW